MIYLDSSAILSVILNEKKSRNIIKAIDAKQIMSSFLLEAEVYATLRRERVEFSLFDYYKDRILWVRPDRSLKPEIETILNAGYVRGADLWHLASALYAKNENLDHNFCSLDLVQRSVAKTCGFKLLPKEL
jgi:predicted nucleic acid-binding protein